MTRERAKSLASKWSAGCVCNLREGEAEEYHKMFYDLLCDKKDAKAEWISVKDRLPYKNQQCLCRYVFIYDDGKESEQGFYRVLWFFASDQNQHFQDEGSFGMRVTHWMPLPETPEKG